MCSLYIVLASVCVRVIICYMQLKCVRACQAELVLMRAEDAAAVQLVLYEVLLLYYVY
jgi:hypothetical protein